MQSPRFTIRAAELAPLFQPSNIIDVWKKKVRVHLKDQLLLDPIEYHDFELNIEVEADKLCNGVLTGNYTPSSAPRLLSEKSRGLCRQLVIPSAVDALVLQCLSDALYDAVAKNAPTNKAYYKQKDHKFSTNKADYGGTFVSWLQFQTKLLQLSHAHKYIVVTDVANFYDSISYAHLRNIVSDITHAKESIIDLLIYVLSHLLWQPDYLPRIEIGLPQIDLDAPRMLAHAFLFELDSYIESSTTNDFARYMDDIDIGVDTLPEAKIILKNIDLVLQTRQVRLNSGKTKILEGPAIWRHFRIFENARADNLERKIGAKKKAGVDVSVERRTARSWLTDGLRKKSFDEGNGEKILKRVIGLCGTSGAYIPNDALLRVLKIWPGSRSNVMSYLRRSDLTPARIRTIEKFVYSGLLVDHEAYAVVCNHLVETCMPTKSGVAAHLENIVGVPVNDRGNFHSSVWLQSKVNETSTILLFLKKHRSIWVRDYHLGRLVGGLRPLFRKSPEWEGYLSLIQRSRNNGARETFKFHTQLEGDLTTFNKAYQFLNAPNGSKGTSINHAKFLCLLSALNNKLTTPVRIDKLLKTHDRSWRDLYYREIVKRTTGYAVVP